MSEAAKKMRQTYEVCGDKWFLIAAEEIEKLSLQVDWLRWGLDEVIKNTDTREISGQENKLKQRLGDQFRVSCEALRQAGLSRTFPGNVQKPTTSLKVE